MTPSTYIIFIRRFATVFILLQAFNCAAQELNDPDTCAKVLNHKYTEYTILCPGEHVQIVGWGDNDEIIRLTGIIKSVSSLGITIDRQRKVQTDTIIKGERLVYSTLVKNSIYIDWDQIYTVKVMRDPSMNLLLLGAEWASIVAAGIAVTTFTPPDLADLILLVFVPVGFITLNRVFHTIRVSAFRIGKFDGLELKSS